MSLDTEIREHAATVNTVSYSMSIGEMVTMYRDGELWVHPEFQRFFRWTIEQKSRFIESLLLGIPIPPIFVAERGDAKWDVIDCHWPRYTIPGVAGSSDPPVAASCDPPAAAWSDPRGRVI